MKYLLLLATIALSIAGCSTDPLDQKYTETAGIQPLLKKEVKPPIDSRIIEFIEMAKLENEQNGISNEDLTFRDLSDQGREMWIQHKATSIVDSIKRKNGYK